MLKRITTIVVLSFTLSACLGVVPPSRQYNNIPLNVRVLGQDTQNIDTIQPIKFTTQANKAWQNTGVFLENGDTVTVTASGQWSPAPMAVSGPEGNKLWSPEVHGIAAGSLMGKLGTNGKPFGIGINQTIRAQDYGMLYLAMNDPFNYLYDNTGTANAEIYVDGNQSSAAARTQFEIVAYSYNDNTGKGQIAAKISGDQFKTRQHLINKIGEIASSKNIAIKAGEEPVKGGNYKVGNEKISNGVLTLDFEALW